MLLLPLLLRCPAMQRRRLRPKGLQGVLLAPRLQNNDRAGLHLVPASQAALHADNVPELHPAPQLLQLFNGAGAIAALRHTGQNNQAACISCTKVSWHMCQGSERARVLTSFTTTSSHSCSCPRSCSRICPCSTMLLHSMS